MKPAAEMTEEQREQELRGYIAPALRCVSAEKAARRVKVTKGGPSVPGVPWEVEAEATVGDALKGLAKIHDLEHTPAEGQRPASVRCKRCGKPVKVEPRGLIPASCVDGCIRACVCGRRIGKDCSKVAARQGIAPMCKPCSVRKNQASKSPEQRSEAVRKGHAARMPKRGGQGIRKGAATRRARKEAAE